MSSTQGLAHEGLAAVERVAVEQRDADAVRVRDELEDAVGGDDEHVVVGRDLVLPDLRRRDDAQRLRLGRKRVIQVLFNMSVPRARVPEKASMLRDRSER